jgi:hypothetical protein
VWDGGEIERRYATEPLCAGILWVKTARLHSALATREKPLPSHVIFAIQLIVTGEDEDEENEGDLGDQRHRWSGALLEIGAGVRNVVGRKCCVASARRERLGR